MLVNCKTCNLKANIECFEYFISKASKVNFNIRPSPSKFKTMAANNEQVTRKH